MKNKENIKVMRCGFIWRSFNPPLYVKAILEGQRSIFGSLLIRRMQEAYLKVKKCIRVIIRPIEV